MTHDGQFELTDFLRKKIVNKTVKDLTNWINGQGKSQYSQIGDVVRNSYERYKDGEDMLDRMTNEMSVYVLEQSMKYMKYLRKESEL